MRVYIPAILSVLEALKKNELFHAHGGWDFTVTEVLREFFTEGDDEELADVTFDEAACASLRLLGAAKEKFPHRQVVISVDIGAEPQSDMEDAVVRVGGPISLAGVATFHIDVKEAKSKVEAAIDTVDKADLGDKDAELTVGDALEIPLA